WNLEAADAPQREPSPGMGRSQEPDVEERRPRRPGLAVVSTGLRRVEALSDDRDAARWTGGHRAAALARAEVRRGDARGARLFRADAERARQLRPGRSVRARERQGLRRRRPSRR